MTCSHPYRIIVLFILPNTPERKPYMTDDVFYTSTELAKLLKITQRTVYRLMERGDLPYYEIGRVKRFRKKEVEEYLQRVRRPG